MASNQKFRVRVLARAQNKNIKIIITVKKQFIIFFILFLTLAIFPLTILAGDCPDTGDPNATGLVPCGVSCSCTISNVFLMLVKIYNFIVLMIATPLAVIAITVGAIFMMLSAGNPGLMGKGKTILYSAIIGLVLVFCSYLIINFILTTIGFTGNWASPF